jgi:hypothetical protein
VSLHSAGVFLGQAGAARGDRQRVAKYAELREKTAGYDTIHGEFSAQTEPLLFPDPDPRK